jgi:integrase
VGRKSSVNRNLPPRMRARVRGGKVYYMYDHGGKPRKETSLGTDYVLAVQKWSTMHESEPTARITVGWVIAKYLESPQFDSVSLGTQADYRFALTKIIRAFGDAPIDQVRSSHVQLYIDKRGTESRHRALREKAVLSMIFSWAMARDFCTSNPVAAIKTKRLPGRRNVYIEDDVMDAVYQRGSPALQDAIDLAYFTGQRPSDVLAMSEADIRDGVLAFGQDKTGKPMRIVVAGDLSKLLQRMANRKRQFSVRALQLLVDEQGKPMTKAKLRSRFEAARALVPGAEEFQFRDLRRKAASDMRDALGIESAQALLGHSSVVMTEHYAGGKAKKVSANSRKPSTGAGS